MPKKHTYYVLTQFDSDGGDDCIGEYEDRKEAIRQFDLSNLDGAAVARIELEKCVEVYNGGELDRRDYSPVKVKKYTGAI